MFIVASTEEGNNDVSEELCRKSPPVFIYSFILFQNSVFGHKEEKNEIYPICEILEI